MEPTYEKKNAVWLKAPERKTVLHWPEEMRFELPFFGKDDSLLYFSKFWYEKWYTPTQYHDYFEMCYVCEGNGWFILEGIRFPVRAGDIFVTKPGEIHCGGSSDGTAFRVYALAFRFEQFTDLEQGFYKLNVGRICNDHSRSIRQTLDRLFDELIADAPYAHHQVRNLLGVVLVEVLRLYQSQTTDSQGKNRLSPIVLQALGHVHTSEPHIDRTANLARRIGVSRSHLDREFKRQMGVALGEYMRGVWLERAKRALRETDRTVTEIAEQLQFESLQAFCVFFKRHTGVSPHRYRLSPEPINEEKR
ncbi:AraC family transcriptional regulator [Paenibacillus spongiae]|uniref:AraC family transcriptional regulator n=1 Tax=Paenibacillus spongiae TaxID=2909671 RepID=A0ABY5S6Z2_9BACL|nr:AraC family transcriptional regulator [Paenibacillus spongiae]UVI29672.1 AraC family transcriptional regulator [Paenibacillus spongiae]